MGGMQIRFSVFNDTAKKGIKNRKLDQVSFRLFYEALKVTRITHLINYFPYFK